MIYHLPVNRFFSSVLIVKIMINVKSIIRKISNTKLNLQANALCIRFCIGRSIITLLYLSHKNPVKSHPCSKWLNYLRRIICKYHSLIYQFYRWDFSLLVRLGHCRICRRLMFRNSIHDNVKVYVHGLNFSIRRSLKLLQILKQVLGE